MINQRPPMQGMANQMAQYGRFGDSMLVHMNPAEVQGIASLSPTGSLTTNPVTGQPEAFLPFLAPLLGSAFGSTILGAAGSVLPGALGSALTGIAGNAALSSAIGSGLATTAVTGDIEKGILSGITGFGLGKVLQGGAEAVMGVPEAAKTTAELASTANTAKMAALQADPTMTAEALSQLPTATTAQQAQTGLDIARTTAGENIGSLFMEDPAKFVSGAGKALTQSGSLVPIGIGEGQREALEAQERFERDARRFERKREDELARARLGLTTAFQRLEQDYPGYRLGGLSMGGITSVNPNNYMNNVRGLQRLAEGGAITEDQSARGRRRAEQETQQTYSDYMGSSAYFGPGSASDRQAGIRPSAVISPEQLQGYRPGFGPEIMYFQDPVIAPPPPGGPITPGNPNDPIGPEGPGDPRGPRGPGSPVDPRGPRGPGSPVDPGGPIDERDPGFGTREGIGGFDVAGFLDSDEGRLAVDTVRSALGIPDFSTIDSRLAAIETRPDPTIPTIDYDEITERVRGGIDIPDFDLSGVESRLGAIENRNIPTIDYDQIMDRVSGGIDIPDFDLSGIESRLGAIEGREIPTIDYDAITSRVREGIDIPEYTAPTFDYDEIANRVRSGIDIPAVDLSGIETRLGAIEGREMPTIDLSGIETRLGAIEGREMPTFDTSGIMSAIDANRQAISGLPTTDLSGIESRLGAIETRPDPTFDASGIMSAIDANRQAIADLPAPTSAFDYSEIMDAIAANRDAIAGLPMALPSVKGEMPTKRIKELPEERALISRSAGGNIPFGLQEGGEVSDESSRIIDLTIEAVMGRLPAEQAEAVINRFIDEFGSEVFAMLRDRVLQEAMPNAQTEGEIVGQGGGMEDMIPGMIGDQQPVAVSPGEFIVPADVVSGLGDGSTDAGVKELNGMMDRVRDERTGTLQQPKPIDKTKVMPV